MVGDLGPPFRLTTVILGTLVFVSVGLRMATVISREWEQVTLVSLLTTPLTSFEILKAKWIGTLLRSRRALAGLAASFVMSGLMIQFDVYEWLLLPLTFLAHVWFVGNLGLWLSVECRSTNRAYSLLLAILIAIVGGAWMGSYFQTSQETSNKNPFLASLPTHQRTFELIDDHERANFGDWVNPPQTWWRLMIRNKIVEHIVDNDRDWLTGFNGKAQYEAMVVYLTERKCVGGHVAGWLIYLVVGSLFGVLSYLRFRGIRARTRPVRRRFLSQPRSPSAPPQFRHSALPTAQGQ
jgi:hypothetical protein